MSETSASKIRDKWNKSGRKDIVNTVIDEAMRIEFVKKGENRQVVRSLFEEWHNKRLPEDDE